MVMRVIVVAVAMVMVAMTVIMIVRGIGMFVGQKLWVDIQDSVEIKAADVDDLFQIGVAEIDGLDRCAWIHVHDTATKRSVLGIRDQIFFRNQDAISKANLFLGFLLFVESFHAVFRVDDGDDCVEAVVLGDVIIHEKSLADRTGVGHTGRLDDDALKIQFATFVTFAQVEQGAHQVATHGAAHAAVGQFDDFFFLILNEQVVIDALGSEFIFDHRDTLSVVLRQDAFQERRFSCAEKAGEDRDGDHLVQTARGVHDQFDFKNG